MGRNLTDLFISESFNYVLQISGSDVQDGLGNSLSGTLLNLNVVSASYAVSASHEIIKEVSSSYADFAQVAGIATSSLSADSVAFSNITGKPTLVSSSAQIDVSATTGNLPANRVSGTVATATSASHALVADTVTGTVTNATYAQNTITTGKNLEATEITKGTPLYFTGSGTSGNIVGILRADAGNPARMPAGGVAGEAIASGAEGIVLIDGYIGGVDTSLFAAGDEVFVGVGGGYTNVAPTGSANLVQKLGNVEKSAVNGSGVINGPGAVRSVPNIAQDHVWKGDANGVPQAVNQNTLSVASAVSSSHSEKADQVNVEVNSSGLKYLAYLDSATAGTRTIQTEAGLVYTPGTNTLTTNTFVGALQGNADTATTASYATVAQSVIGTITSASYAATASIVTDSNVARKNVNNNFTTTQNVTGNVQATNLVQGASLRGVDGDIQANIVGASGGYFEVLDNSNFDNIGFGLNTQTYGTSGWTGPAIWGNNPANGFPVLIGFQNKASWTDGRVTFLTPISASAGVIGNASTATSASYAINAATASVLLGSVASASYAETANSLTPGNKTLATGTFTVGGAGGVFTRIEDDVVTVAESNYVSTLDSDPGLGPHVNLQDTALGDGFGLSTKSSGGLSGNWTTGPAIFHTNTSGVKVAAVGFQNKANYTDGRVTFLTPISASAGITGDLTGNASTATSASHALFAVTASYALNGGGGGTVDTGSLLITGSVSDATLTFTKGDSSTFNLVVNNVESATSASYAASTKEVDILGKGDNQNYYISFTTVSGGTIPFKAPLYTDNGGGLVYNPSTNKIVNAGLTGNADTATSASYALTASYAQNAGQWDGTYVGNASITGSLVVSGSTFNVKQRFPAPLSIDQIYSIDGYTSTATGDTWDATTIAMFNYGAFGKNFDGSFQISKSDIPGNIYGTWLNSGYEIGTQFASVSGSLGSNRISTQANGNGLLISYAHDTQIGAFAGANGALGTLLLGNTNNTNTIISTGGVIQLSGSVDAKDTVTLHTVEISGSLEHSGSQFTVKIPAPSNNVPAGTGYGAEYFLDWENLLSSQNQDYDHARLWAYHVTGSKAQDNRLALRKCKAGNDFLWSELFNSGYEVGTEQFTVSGSHGKIALDTQGGTGNGLVKIYAHDMQIGAFSAHTGSMTIGNTGQQSISIATGGTVSITGSLVHSGSLYVDLPVQANNSIETYINFQPYTSPQTGDTWSEFVLKKFNFPSFGTAFDNALYLSKNNTNPSTDFLISGYDIGHTMETVSGSLGSNRMITQPGNGNSKLISYANDIELGAFGGSGGHLGSLTIGNTNNSGIDIKTGGTVKISGSVAGQVNSLSIASLSASLDASNGNYFDLTLVSGSNTHVTVSNIQPGQTYILKTVQPTSAADSVGTITFNSEFKFAGGTAPTATAVTGSVDVYTFVSFDSSNVLSTQVADLK